MDKTNKGILSLIAKTLLLLLFLSYTVSINMFYHSHSINGTRITHSHFYKFWIEKGIRENHSHSPTEFILIRYVCETTMTDSLFEFIFVPYPIYNFCGLIISTYLESFSGYVKSSELSRAPPVC